MLHCTLLDFFGRARMLIGTFNLKFSVKKFSNLLLIFSFILVGIGYVVLLYDISGSNFVLVNKAFASQVKTCFIKIKYVKDARSMPQSILRNR